MYFIQIYFFFCSSSEIPISDFTLAIKSGVPDFELLAVNFPPVSGKTMQNEVFEFAFRRSENMVIRVLPTFQFRDTKLDIFLAKISTYCKETIVF